MAKFRLPQRFVIIDFNTCSLKNKMNGGCFFPPLIFQQIWGIKKHILFIYTSWRFYLPSRISNIRKAVRMQNLRVASIFHFALIFICSTQSVAKISSANSLCYSGVGAIIDSTSCSLKSKLAQLAGIFLPFNFSSRFVELRK